MVWVLTARKNKTLTQALLYHANGKSYKKMDRAMHKAAVQAERRMRNYRPGCLEGRIGFMELLLPPWEDLPERYRNTN